MTKLRKVINAKEDKNGNISAVLIEGNTNFTNLNTAKKMAMNKKIDLVYVKPSKNATDYVRQKPDTKKSNNLDDMAKN
ncbi:MAG: hypothetical protein ACI9YH_004208 [Colwellia sp.]|jgi:hypothetical protein